LAGSPFARTVAGKPSATTATASSVSRLAKRVDRQKDDNDARCQSGGERDERGGQNQRDASHPFARATNNTVNGCVSGGVISNDRAQCPTMIRAGASRWYRPGPFTGNRYVCLPISMSSMANPARTDAPFSGWPPRVIRTEKVFRAAARFGVTWNWSRYPFLFTTSVTGPGPTRPIEPPVLASAFAGGGKLESTAAATIAETTRSASPATSRRSSAAAPGASSGRSAYAARRGFVRRRFTAASRIADASNPILTSSV